MAKGRKTGGRTKGTHNKRTKALMELGFSPAEEMIKLYKAGKLKTEDQILLLRSLLPYFHPKPKSPEIEDADMPEICCIHGLDITKI